MSDSYIRIFMGDENISIGDEKVKDNKVYFKSIFGTIPFFSKMQELLVNVNDVPELVYKLKIPSSEKITEIRIRLCDLYGREATGILNPQIYAELKSTKARLREALTEVEVLKGQLGIMHNQDRIIKETKVMFENVHGLDRGNFSTPYSNKPQIKMLD